MTAATLPDTTVTLPDSEFTGFDRWIQFGPARDHYRYHLRYNAGDELPEVLSPLGTDLFVLVADAGLPPSMIAQTQRQIAKVAPCIVLKFRGGEQAKNITTVQRLARKAKLAGATHRSVVVAFGGGCAGNVAGFLSGVLFRGSPPLVHIPTTPENAFDAVLSHKQGVNLDDVKNLVGLYKPPKLVWTDLRYMESLARREFRAFMNECIKNTAGICPEHYDEVLALLDPDGIYTLAQLARIAELNIEAKTRVMCNDPREQRDGVVLELGHTVGHAAELLAGLRHGEAVGLGLRVAAIVGRLLGGRGGEAAEAALYALLDRNGAPTRLPAGVTPEQILRVVARDNKRGRLPVKAAHHVMVVLEQLGWPRRTDGLPLVHVPENVLHEALQELAPAA
jgi:3-dehydroquinate synthetase